MLVFATDDGTGKYVEMTTGTSTTDEHNHAYIMRVETHGGFIGGIQGSLSTVLPYVHVDGLCLKQISSPTRCCSFIFYTLRYASDMCPPI